MSIQTVEIALLTGIDSVSVGLAEPISIVEVRQGPAGPGGSAVIDAATQSDGTAALYLDSIRFEATNGGPTQLGEMAWESNDGSIDAMLESGVIVAMGEDLVIRVRNTTASPITKGTALAYDGTSGASGRIEVKPWVGSNIPTAKLFLGFAACDMPANSNGYSQWFGKLAEINTSGGAQTWLDEQIIYAVPGASATITNVAPTSGEYAAAAVVINAGSGTSGILFVRPTFEVASSTSATANTLVLRDGSGGASLSTVTLSGTGGSPFTSTLTGGVNFANRTLVLPDVSGTLTTVESLANSATITASTAVAVDTIVLRDSAGVINITSSNVTSGTNYADTAGWTYAGSAASAHRTALGLGSADDVGFRTVNVSGTAPVNTPMAGIGLTGSGHFALFANSTVRMVLISTGATIGSGSGYAWSSVGIPTNATRDLILSRDDSGTLAQRNGTAAQESRIYGTYTGATNFERLSLKYTAADTAFQIGTEKGSAGGVAQPLQFRTDSTTRMAITTTGNVGIGTTSPSALLDVNSDTVRVRTARTPASATAAGNAGDICWDADYIYVCTATNTWKRTAISTWP
jgi:hypothetical protein